MTQEIPTSTKLCPTCGTRVAAEADRCLVCGAEFNKSDRPANSNNPVQSSRLPFVTLSLPVAILLMAVFLTIGAVLVYLALKSQPEVVIPSTPTNTETITVTPSLTATQLPPTMTLTPEPSPTPATYQVRDGDTCISIAFFFDVSVQSIVTLNNLPAACDNLFVGQQLSIPQATATPTSLPSATFSVAEQTEDACEKVEYTVQENDTLSTIASAYDIPMAALQDYNGLVGDRVLLGQKIIIPLCRRFATPGPSPTFTPPPPYPAPNLLLPVDGAPFVAAADGAISLQWASVGTLRETELYQVTIEDITLADGTNFIDYVADTKYIVPQSIQPKDKIPHIIRWSVRVVRQIDTDEEGRPVWEEAGVSSIQRVFSWTESSIGATPTP